MSAMASLDSRPDQRVAFHSRPLCIFHSQNGVQHCDDGFAAAWVVNDHFKGAADFHPGVYGRDPPEVEGRDLIVTDFSYPTPVMMELARRAKSLLFIDHHKSVIDTAARVDHEFDNATVVFDTSRCGALLTWNFFHPGELAPAFFEYINDRDLFLHKLPGCREFSLALRSWPQAFPNWSSLMSDLAALKADGVGITRYYDRQCAMMATNAHEMVIAGHKVKAANAPLIFASEVAGILAQGAPFGAAYVIDDTRKVVFSLRSEENGEDVSAIAKVYGGGGHRGAAGFNRPLTFLPWGDGPAAANDERRATSALQP